MLSRKIILGIALLSGCAFNGQTSQAAEPLKASAVLDGCMASRLYPDATKAPEGLRNAIMTCRLTIDLVMRLDKRAGVCWEDLPDNVRLDTRRLTGVVEGYVWRVPASRDQDFRSVVKAALQAAFPCRGPRVRGKPYPDGVALPLPQPGK
jgi:hypothetical protein